MQNDNAKLKSYHNIIKKGSLQKIEDFYLNLGYRGADLREVLLKDENYKSLLKRKKAVLSLKSKANESDKIRYVLSTDADIEILAKCKKVEKLKLTKDDRLMVELIKSQLETDWRLSLQEQIERVMMKYQK